MNSGRRAVAAVCSAMGSADQFMRYAAEALRAAALARAEKERLALIELAQTWVEAALRSVPQS